MCKQNEELLRAVSNGRATFVPDRHDIERCSQSLREKSKSRNLHLSLLFLLGVAAPLSLMAQGAYPPFAPTIPTVTLTGAPAIQEPAPNPPDQQSAWNMELAGYSDLQGRSAYQPIIINENGREIAYVGHHTGSAMNPLNLLRPNGSQSQEIYDVTDPAHPNRLTVVVDGLTGTHKNWWECDTGIAYLVANKRSEGWKGGNHMKIYDLSDPAKPAYIRDFGLLGQQPNATSHEGLAPAIGIHGPISTGVEKNRVYAAYGTGSNGVIQILDRKKLLTAFENSLNPTTEEMLAPQLGYITMSPDQGAHTVFPVYGVPIPEFQGHTALRKRDLMIVPSESSRGDRCAPGPNGDRPAPHLAFLLDITVEAAPWPLSTFRVPETPGDFCGKGGRFGAHASTESFYPPYYGKLAIFSWFNAGTRVWDIRDPFAVQEVAYFIPAPNKNTMAFCPDGVSHAPGDPKITPACSKVIQTNNVELDDRGLIYSADRAGTGLHIMRLTGHAKDVVAAK